MEIWTTGVAGPRRAGRAAAELEAAGWEGFLVVDSQNLSGDPYVALAMAATATTRIGLGTGVTNSVTRHAAVTAGSIASIQLLSGGRAVLGIGRGDSALAHLGRAPARLASFERYLRQLQTYLRGEAVPFEEIDLPAETAPPMSELELADAPEASRIGWIAERAARVPVEVAASGPKVIAIAALHADRVMFALGADEERIAWGISLAREARRRAGLDPDGIAFGAYLNCGCHPDVDAARNLVKGGADHLRAVLGDARPRQRSGERAGPRGAHRPAQQLRHARSYARQPRQAGVLTPEFIDRFAIAGPPDRCIARLRGLAALGLDKVALTGAMRGVSEADAATSRRLLETEVLPAMKHEAAD